MLFPFWMGSDGFREPRFSLTSRQQFPSQLQMRLEQLRTERFLLAPLTRQGLNSKLRKRVRTQHCCFSHIIYDNICRICTLHSIYTSPRSVCCDFPANSQSRYSVSPAQISEMMFHFLKRHDQTLASGGELLPTLKSICGQVSKLRLDDAAVETETQMTNGTWWVHPRLFRQHLSVKKKWSMYKNCR